MHRTHARFHRWAGGILGTVAVFTAVLLAQPAVAAGGVTPDGTNPPEWGWVAVRQPKTNVTRLSPISSANSYHSTNGFLRHAAGWYTVTFRDVGASGGGVLVSAMGAGPHVCLADSWAEVGSAPTDESVDVRCYAKNGVAADSAFVVNWVSLTDIGGRFAYARNFSPTDNCGIPGPQYDTYGGMVKTCVVHPYGLPQLPEVQIPHLGDPGGIVQVSAIAHRADNPGPTSAGFCVLINFRRVEFTLYDPDEFADSLCYDLHGTPSQQIYREHSVWFMQGVGMEGIGGAYAAYLLADRPHAASYSPTSASAYSTGGRITITRNGTGDYSVELKGQPLGGSAQVTAMGTAPRYCVIRTIRTALPQGIGVLCFDGAGTPRDTEFTLSFAR